MAKGYGEAMALIETGKQLALAAMVKPEKEKRTVPEKKEKPPSWEQLWLEEQQRREKFDAFMKVLKKQLTDEKKEDKKHWMQDVDKVALLLLATIPLNWGILWMLFK